MERTAFPILRDWAAYAPGSPRVEGFQTGDVGVREVGETQLAAMPRGVGERQLGVGMRDLTPEPSRLPAGHYGGAVRRDRRDPAQAS
jgi:hypothetical protein